MTEKKRSEREIMTKGLIQLSKLGFRLFRNNIAKGWIGESTLFRKREIIEVESGDVLIKNARRLHSGFPEGSGDSLGWRKVVITQEMVGKQILQFASAEAKAEGKYIKKGSKQDHWKNLINSEGGIAIEYNDEKKIKTALQSSEYM